MIRACNNIARAGLGTRTFRTPLLQKKNSILIASEVARYSTSTATEKASPSSGSVNGVTAAGLILTTGLLTYWITSTQKGASSIADASSQKNSKALQVEFAPALKALKAHFSGVEGALSTDESDLEERGNSQWTEIQGSEPSVVVFPSSTEDVVAVVKIARKHNVPITPFAGGTSLEGQAFAPRDPKTGKTVPTISIAFDNMNEIVELDEESAICKVQPGLGWQDLNEQLKERGSVLFWPIDPGPGAAFGGMLSTGGSGTGAVKYGTMKGDLILNVTVVLPSGQVIKTRADARKSAAGPDMTKIFLGAEGTLGIITEVTLRLAPKLPEAVLTVPFDTVENACKAVVEVLNHGVGVSSVELLDEEMIKAINKASNPVPLHPEQPSLFFKFSGSHAHVAEDQRLTTEIVERHGADMAALHRSRNEAEVEEIWKSRKIALWSAIQYRSDGHEGFNSWGTDVCVPIARLPKLVDLVKKDIAEHDLYGPIVGHVGDGNFHAALIYEHGDKEMLKKIEGAVHRMVHTAQDLGGTATGEHGVGRGKREYLERELGPGTIHLLRSIKKMLDPTNIMNPGALLLPELSEEEKAFATASSI
ncbi:hypothetical protein CBS101457_000026 [Exobasidium rhododendri]|nr:hypothetical protein CBS101457_000026 [Exobasidium rhododendri]